MSLKSAWICWYRTWPWMSLKSPWIWLFLTCINPAYNIFRSCSILQFRFKCFTSTFTELVRFLWWLLVWWLSHAKILKSTQEKTLNFTFARPSQLTLIPRMLRDWFRRILWNKFVNERRKNTQVKADFQSSHEAPRSELRVHAWALSSNHNAKQFILIRCKHSRRAARSFVRGLEIRLEKWAFQNNEKTHLCHCLMTPT